VTPDEFALALWHATGTEAHLAWGKRQMTARGWRMEGYRLVDQQGERIPVPDERTLYERLGLPCLPPEVRMDPVDPVGLDARVAGLVTPNDLQGALHCHSVDSDGSETIAALAEAAQQAGLRYLGISDHSQSSTYAGGLTRDAIRTQHQRIDELNAGYADRGLDFCLLKGIEADILPCGRLDYDDHLLDAFDFVIGSIHTRFGMNERQMTDRVLRALDDPHLTILGHPTGRLLLTREPYAIDLAAVIGKAATVGVAIELNADPHRLDLDWRGCGLARSLGAQVSIGPDAHAPAGFANLRHGVTQARRGWLAPAHVLNTRSADDVRAFARRRRALR
jgi:DNA polymerase (family 10)